MEHEYIIYPKAKKKLEESGLKKRIDDYSKKNSDSYPDMFYGFNYKEDVINQCNYMKEQGYFDNIPEEINKEFKDTLNRMFEKGGLEWTIQRDDNVVDKDNKKEKIEKVDLGNEGILLLMGYYASEILNPEEFWQKDRFGFESYSDMFATVGLQMYENTKISNRREGYKWKSRHKDKDFISTVTGSIHGDLRIFRTDITAYHAKDPFGKDISYRPITNKDRNILAAYHSMEPALLTAILKYARQENIRSDILKNDAKDFLREVNKGKSFLGNFADAGYDLFGAESHFFNFGFPIPSIDEIIKYSPFSQVTESRGSYDIRIDEENDLTFRYHDEEGNPYEERKLTIPKKETDNLIRGLFFQAKNGLGRTSLKQLTDMVEFYFSEEGRKETKKLEQEYKKLEEERILKSKKIDN